MKRLVFFLLALTLCMTATADEVVKQRIKQMQRTVPMQYNQEVQTYITRYLKAPGMISRVRGLSEYYFPIIEQVFRENGLPTELKYLTLVESKAQPACCLSAWCCRSMAVYACVRQGIRPATYGLRG